ncbi:permease [Cohnella panacarvi]|uniref:permease n=1 Tax=Cohnella panacarvi TaxID=400776 RepID=UPI00047D8CDC|nr:permease [Cohnella panacarvi]
MHWDFDKLQTFKIIFISIILEALPFLLIGVLVSAILQAFVSDRLIGKLTPRHPITGALFGSLLGIVLPLCECGMIPIVRRLIRKGLPAYIGLTYIVAGPILNPVVVSATFAAFRTNRELAYSRFYLAFLVSFALGLLLYSFMSKNPMKAESHHHHQHHRNNRLHASVGSSGFMHKLAHTPGHAAEEFFDMGKFLLFGAFFTALLQTVISRQAIAAVADHDFGSQLFMMGLAYLLSLCSTSDAFVAASFNSLFPPTALLAFLVFGPMVDLKSTLMLLSVFRRKFVLAFILLLFALVFVGSFLFGELGWV